MRLLRLCLLPLVVLLAAGIATCAVAQEPAPRPEAEQAEASDARAPSLQPQPSEESKASEKSEAAEQPAPIQAESPAPSRDQSSPAKTEAQAEGAARKNDGAKSAVAAKPSLPADSVTRHTLDLPGRTLQLEATAGSIPLMNADGRALSPSSGRRQGPSVPRCSQADDDPGPPLNANATGRVRLSTPMSVYDT